MDREYGTVMADPPWPYEQDHHWGAAEKHYEVMPVEEIAALPVDEWTRDESHLYLWTTNAFMREAFEVMESWGFDQKTILTWVKADPNRPENVRLSAGWYFRNVTEHILFGAKGNAETATTERTTVFYAEPTKHSTKPEIAYRLAEEVSPGPYLEMFSRGSREPWDPWGDEAHKVKSAADW